MNFNTFLLLVLLFGSLTITSCGDDGPDCDEASVSQYLGEETEKLTEFLFSLTSDPINFDCNDFKDAYEDYINALENLQDCADEVGQGSEYRQAIQEGKDALDDLVC